MEEIKTDKSVFTLDKKVENVVHNGEGIIPNMNVVGNGFHTYGGQLLLRVGQSRYWIYYQC